MRRGAHQHPWSRNKGGSGGSTVTKPSAISSVSAPECRRRFASRLREYSREMALVRETDPLGNFGERQGRVPNQSLGCLDAAVTEIAVWRHAGTLLERSAKMPHRKTGDTRQFAQRNPCRDVIIYVLANTAQTKARHSTSRRSCPMRPCISHGTDEVSNGSDDLLLKALH